MMKKILFLLAAILVFSFCDRELDFPTKTVTPPALEVQVEGISTATNFPKISDATVQLYSSSGELLKTGTSDSNGRCLFTKEDLKEKGVFTVKAAKGDLSGEGKTPYMLLNDGVTLLIITIR